VLPAGRSRLRSDRKACLIEHGEADSIVQVSSAYRLRDAVIAHGGEVEMHVYPGAEHAFNAPWPKD
jgi:dipeptidyl aminopeptidase/acylaminoacyl peptidase